MTASEALSLDPIGILRTPFADKRSAPRQPAAARGVRGTIELSAHGNYEHALADLEAWSHIWVIFWFHENAGWRPKVLPPRSASKRGVLSTRSPHRPNPLGLSVLRLERIEGRVLHVLDVDMLDRTPVLDIKPYVPYTDAIPEAKSGWLQGAGAAEPEDPGPRYRVVFEPLAQEQLTWLAARTPLPLQSLIEEVLSLGPAPHPYRRIRDLGDHLCLAVKDFRVRFVVVGDEARVQEITSGYRGRVLEDPRAVATETTPLSVHRELVARYGQRGKR